MSFVEIKDLTVKYGEKTVFAALDLSIERGEIFCLIGPNGCGKTTLQHTLLQLIKPFSGEIFVDGRAASSYKTRQMASKIAFVPQSHARTFPYQTVDVVAMGSLRTRGIFGSDEQGSTEKAREIMEALGIGQLADVPYTTLSGGELQMVMIARALCQESEMLVLDEPTAHLDIGKAQEILRTISRINREEKKTILIASHDLNQPLYFEDEGNPVRMALMNEGRISQVAGPRELLESEAPKKLYGVDSRVLSVDAGGKKRHFLVTWKEADG